MNERSYIPLRTAQNITEYRYRTEKFKRSFFPSIFSLWNSIDLDVKNSTSNVNFKAKITKLYHSLHYDKWLNFSLSRKASVFHTRLRLGYCALRDRSLFIPWVGTEEIWVG